MATTYKVLGQAAPTGTTNTNLYTVPSATSAVGATLAICNTTSSDVTHRVFVRIAGATAAASNAITYDTVIAANTTQFLTVGLTLATTDVITVRSSVANALTFTLTGSEIA